MGLERDWSGYLQNRDIDAADWLIAETRRDLSDSRRALKIRRTGAGRRNQRMDSSGIFPKESPTRGAALLGFVGRAM